MTFITTPTGTVLLQALYSGSDETEIVGAYVEGHIAPEQFQDILSAALHDRSASSDFCLMEEADCTVALAATSAHDYFWDEDDEANDLVTFHIVPSDHPEAYPVTVAWWGID
ncbi:hypothetical protein CCAX7_54980 [Capsulimonas corticalis]|uniref:Uncharacterized protein n=1 Tax=Capsulimonas corticalis TaxID=2219043 RepID=A0A402D5Q1_9BACT|nr:hypothetical protein [Capsulimonas corticalis]BDI33447.1 hypothetical protein CCAX7_54980 [Capsulimonas corticalis]